MKIRPVVAELFHADGRTDRRDEANSCSSRFCERAHKRSEVQLTICAPRRRNGEEEL